MTTVETVVRSVYLAGSYGLVYGAAFLGGFGLTHTLSLVLGDPSPVLALLAGMTAMVGVAVLASSGQLGGVLGA